MVGHSRRKIPFLVIPALLVIGAVTAYPLARTFSLSFTDVRLGTLDHPSWIGFGNYHYLFMDPDWWIAVSNTTLFVVFSVLLETTFGLAVALLLNSAIRGRGLLRTAVLVPWAIPAVVSARIWAWMFNDVYGVVNQTLASLHLTDGTTAWLADPHLGLLTLIIVDVWKTTPFMALMLLAGLQSIPKSLYEAAQVDGASSWQQFRHITLPLLRPALWVSILFRMLDAIRVFDLPYVLTSNSRSTAVVSIYARQQMIDYQELGYGSAASFLIFSMTAIIALIYLNSVKEHLGLRA